MIDLDRPERYPDVDRSDALGVTLGAWRQWGPVEGPAALPDGVSRVLVAGMGGSGIAGDVLAAVAAGVLDVPVLVQRDAGLPAFVDHRTLLLAVSYSGATSETLACTERALAAGAPVVAVTSGGPLAARVAAAGGPVVRIPGGHQPRHALGWLASAVLSVCGLAGDLEAAGRAQRTVAERCLPEVPSARNPAKRLGQAIAATELVVAWGTGPVSAVAARRLACQVNEHTKLPAFHSVLPELAHNEVAGWQGAGDAPRGLVVLRDPAGESDEARARVAPARERAAGGCSWTRELEAPAGPAVARLAGLAMLVDAASVYAAIARGVDPTPIDNIESLKAVLGAGAT